MTRISRRGLLAGLAVAVGYERAVTYDWVVRQFDPVDRETATPRSRPLTANYLLTPSVAVRAATDGHVTPGPHPTAAGERLACE